VRMQDSQAGCGPTALHNALAALGLKRTQAECELLCGTTATDGTPFKRLVAGTRKIPELIPCPLRESRADVAMLKLEAALRAGRPVLMVVDDGEHWVAAVGTLGGRVLVADSADNDLVLSYSPTELEHRWKEEGAGKPFQGVIL